MLRELTRRAADPPRPPLPMNDALRSLPVNEAPLAEACRSPLGTADGALVLGLVACELSRLRGGAVSAIGGGVSCGEAGRGAVPAAGGDRLEAVERAGERLEAAASSMTGQEASGYG